MVVSQKPIVKVEASLQELRSPKLPSPPPFVIKKFADLPKNFRGTATFKEATAASNGVGQDQSMNSYQWSVTPPVAALDRKTRPQDSPHVQEVTRKYNHANHLLRSGNSKGAAIELRFIISVQPNFAEAHNNYGAALFQQGRFQEAEAEWREALKLDPTNALYNLNYKKALARTGLFVGMFVSMDTLLPDREPKANFMVSDLAEGPIYNVLVRDAFFRNSPPTVIENGFRDHIGRISVLPKKIALFCDSLYGERLPSLPTGYRDLEIQVTYSTSPAGLPQTKAFLFVPRQDQKGIWHWYPDLNDALSRAEAAILPFSNAPFSPTSP